MTTYTIPTLQLSPQLANSSNANRYPVKKLDLQYTPTNTMYMKHGDTVSVAVNNPASGQTQYKYIYSVNSQGGNVTAQSYPTPDNLNAYGSSQFYNNNTSRTLTWPASLVDSNTTYGPKDDTQWPFVGDPFISGGGTTGGYSYSGKVRIGIATGVIYFSGGASSATIQRGNSIFIYSGGSIGGLHPSANHTWGDKLYLSVMTSTGTNEISSGISWNTGSQWIGFMSPNMATVQLSVASTVAPGTYKIHLNHYSINSGRSGVDGRMSTITLTVTAPSNPNPNAFSFTNPTASTVTRTSTINSNSVTLAGMDTSSSVTQLTSGFTATANGSAISLNSAVPQNAAIVLSTTSSGTYGASVTGTIRIGTTTSGTWTVTTQADPGTGPGGGSAASGDYGIEVRNASGVVTFSPSRRTINFINASTGPIIINAGATVYNLSAEGMTPNNATYIAVLIDTPGLSTLVPDFTIGRGTNIFSITNTSASQATVNWMVVRY